MFERRVVSILSGRHIAHVQYLLELKSENHFAIHAIRKKHTTKKQYFLHTLSTSNHYL